MTISAKLTDIGGDEFAVSDETDTTDVNGFSDSLPIVGAKTAKFSVFSGSATMQANPGLRIGLKQVKINTGSGIARVRSIVAGSDTGTDSPTRMINGSFSPPGTSRTAVGQYAIIDFRSVDTQLLKISFIRNTNRNQNQKISMI